MPFLSLGTSSKKLSSVSSIEISFLSIVIKVNVDVTKTLPILAISKYVFELTFCECKNSVLPRTETKTPYESKSRLFSFLCNNLFVFSKCTLITSNYNLYYNYSAWQN